MSTYTGFVHGAIYHTQNLASIAWVVYSPNDELVTSGGFFLGLATNNVAEYHVVISLLIEASHLGISYMFFTLIPNSWFHSSIVSTLLAILFSYNSTYVFISLRDILIIFIMNTLQGN